jgi:hypothetical protein
MSLKPTLKSIAAAMNPPVLNGFARNQTKSVDQTAVIRSLRAEILDLKEQLRKCQSHS